jgi:hypothetical protein
VRVPGDGRRRPARADRESIFELEGDISYGDKLAVREVHQGILSLLALQAPVAGDLRLNAVDIGEQTAFVVTGLFREFEDASHRRQAHLAAMAKAQPIDGLTAETRFADAAAATVETRTREVFRHAAGVLDAEGVHDTRVATRRLRAALEVFADCFEPKRHKRLLREVKQLAAALGPRRDADVAIEQLQDLAAELPEREAREVEALIGELRDEQSIGRERIAAKLADVHDGDLEGRLLDLAGEARR